MYRLIVENEAGDSMELTNNRNYDVLEITGTNPPAAAINTDAIVGIDGTRFNSSRVEQRNIVITLAIHHNVEANRIALYSFFRCKRKIKIMYQNSRRNVFIEGYVESFENSLFSNVQKPQISIICPSAFWLSASDMSVVFSYSQALFEFPFSIPAEGIEFSRIGQMSSAIINAGEVDTGGIIRFTATAEVQNPVFYNLTTGQYFGLNFVMQTGDVITINTQKGQKSVSLLRGGSVSNLLSYRSSGSTWVEFKNGENTLSFDAGEGSAFLHVSVTLTQKFEGV